MSHYEAAAGTAHAGAPDHEVSERSEYSGGGEREKGSIADVALQYAAAGWAVFPCHWEGARRKQPLTSHGFKDASIDPAQIASWWRRWPQALIGTPTGGRFVVLDVDLRNGGDGTLAGLGFPVLPATPTVRTRSGGWHLYFSPVGSDLRNTQGARGRGIGPGLDWRAAGGYVILPAPGTGYEWVSATLEVPLAPVPVGLLPNEGVCIGPYNIGIVGSAARTEELSPYGKAALRDAVARILAAPNGEQRATLNGEAYSIGRLAAAGGVPCEIALRCLIAAADKLHTYDPGRPWLVGQAAAIAKRAFREGLAKPRPSAGEIIAELSRREWSEAGDER